MKDLSILVLIIALSQVIFAQHTFSIVAIDTLTNEVGSAGATCLNSADCAQCNAAIISELVPGRGAVNAQASVCLPNSNLSAAIADMMLGLSPEEILNNRIDNDACQFGNITDRQYGIADLDGNGGARTIAYTGTNALDTASHIIGINYTVQGNILISEEVLTGMQAGFVNTTGTLAQKLMAAMQGAKIPGADSRCLADGISSKSAYLRVACPSDMGTDYCIDLNVTDMPTGIDPIDSLQNLFDKEIVAVNDVFSLSAKVFPTIAKDIINIQLEENGQSYDIRISNTKGTIIINHSTNNSTQLNISNLPAGIYFIHISNRKGDYFTQKITII